MSEPEIQINGIAHLQLSVRDFAACRAFYQGLLGAFGMTVLIDGDDFFYAIGARTGIALTPVDTEHAGERYHQRRAGLHHLCFRARSREDVDAAARKAEGLGGTIVHPPRQDDLFAPGYYSVLFEDPDGIRIEVNHVPGKGWLSAADEGAAPRP